MKRKASILTPPGILLILAALFFLLQGENTFQYVFLPDGKETAPILTNLEKEWAEIFPAVSLHGVTEQASLRAGSRSEENVTLNQVQGSYFAVYPRRFVSGRPITRGDAGTRTIVLDEKLAFRLFGDQDPLSAEITLGEKKYTVVGVAAHIRRPGEAGIYSAWIPLGLEDAPACRTLILSTPDTGGLWTRFESDARDAFGDGQGIFLRKERMRGTVLLRFVLLIFAIRLLSRWIRKLGVWFRTWLQEIREKLRVRYPRQMIGTFLSRGGLAFLLTGATLALAAGLVVWEAQLLQIFPEWVPEMLSFEDISKVFWALTTQYAAPVQFRTPELAEIRLWSGFLRWGIVLTLLGLTLRKHWKDDES